MLGYKLNSAKGEQDPGECHRLGWQGVSTAESSTQQDAEKLRQVRKAGQAKAIPSREGAGAGLWDLARWEEKMGGLWTKAAMLAHFSRLSEDCCPWSWGQGEG